MKGVFAGLALTALLTAANAQAAPGDYAAAYLDHAIALMERHSINREHVDWDELRARVFAEAAGAETPADTYPALRLALRLLGDNHSALIPPDDGSPRFHESAARTPSSSLPSGRHLGAFAYLHVPGHAGGDHAADRAFAEALQSLIQELDGRGTCGWVVDLRDNPGGNMWPMLAGLQPLLGTGVVGEFRYPDGGATPWWVRPGAAGSGQAVHATSRFAYTLHEARAPVALLFGPATASSGEAVAVAFRGRDATRSFGTATFGVTTGNRGFVLDDGAVLFVTASRFADRDGNVYGGMLEPDVETDEDRALAEATRWLTREKRCAPDGA